MTIKLAKTAGFCMGVRRAVSIVLEEVHNNDEPIYTYGPLIHNDQTINLLKSRNILIIDDLEKINGKTIVIRAHGVPENTKEKIKNGGGKICDATCPHVSYAQSIIKKYANNGYTIIIIGDKGHAEVLGLLGYSSSKGLVVENGSDIENLPNDFEKVCVVAQTTQEKEYFEELVKLIKSKYSNVEVFETICNSTANRQKEVIELCKEVDAMVVVGGRKSANTKRLAEISISRGIPTFQIETADEINKNEMIRFKNIGVTAGASTPNWIIRNVIEKLYDIQQSNRFAISNIFYNFVKILIKSQIYLAIGAAALTFTTCLMMGITMHSNYLINKISHYVVLSFFYVLSMHIANRYFILPKGEMPLDTTQIFFMKHKKFLINILWISIIISIYISYTLGKHILLLMVLSILLGTLYTVAIIPQRIVKIIKYRRLKDIPGSKDIFTAVGWGMSSIIIPFLSSTEKHYAALLPTAIFAITIVLIRAILSDLSEIENDIIVGRETLPIIFGRKIAIKLIVFSSIALILMLLISGIFNIVYPLLSYSLILIPVLCLINLMLYKKGILAYSFYFNVLLDGEFIICGFIGLLFIYFQMFIHNIL